jgi:hypothetical protein
MTSPVGPLRPAIVLRTAEESCTVVTGGQVREATYAPPFPRPRTERVAPGNLVALTAAGVVVWRWYDAVVLEHDGPAVVVWEPAHGPVTASPRDPRRSYRPGGRAYVSAGLPGADWWIAGPAVDRAEDADVDLDQVGEFWA